MFIHCRACNPLDVHVSGRLLSERNSVVSVIATMSFKGSAAILSVIEEKNLSTPGGFIEKQRFYGNRAGVDVVADVF